LFPWSPSGEIVTAKELQMVIRMEPELPLQFLAVAAAAGRPAAWMVRDLKCRYIARQEVSTRKALAAIAAVECSEGTGHAATNALCLASSSGLEVRGFLLRVVTFSKRPRFPAREHSMCKCFGWFKSADESLYNPPESRRLRRQMRSGQALWFEWPKPGPSAGSRELPRLRCEFGLAARAFRP
jgi:hypothetical protein